MTIEEYRQALESLTPTQFNDFRGRWGGTRDTVDACVAEFAYAPNQNRAQWDQIAVFHLRALGVSWLRTEQEKSIELAERSAAAASDSAEAAQRSAAASERSAAAAESSAASAKVVRRTGWYAVIAALLGSAVTVALARGC